MRQLVELKVVGRTVDYLIEGSSRHAELLVMLLSNVTVSDAACEQMLQTGLRSVAGFNMYAAASRVVNAIFHQAF